MMFTSWPKGHISYIFYYIYTKWVCEMPKHWTGYPFRIVGVVVPIIFPIREPTIFATESVWKSRKTLTNIKHKACLTKSNKNGRRHVKHYQQSLLVFRHSFLEVPQRICAILSDRISKIYSLSQWLIFCKQWGLSPFSLILLTCYRWNEINSIDLRNDRIRSILVD